MSGKSWKACALAVAALAALASGCNTQPRIVIEKLPVETIPEASPGGAVSRPVEPVNHQVRTQPPYRTPPEWTPKVFARPWKWIVVHHSATDIGSAEIFDRNHRQRGWDELGYHFVIGNGRGATDGKVEVGSRWTKQKWGAHCKTPDNAYNNYGIGICLVGKYSNKLPSPAQLESLQRLVTFMCDRYDIDPANVIGHRDAPGTKTECPGDALHRYIHTTLRRKLTNRP